jgi:hypothetical protein
MDSHNKLDVDDWQDSPTPVVRRRAPPRRFLSPTLIGILGTLLLHALVIQSLRFGRGLKAKPPEMRDPAVSFAKRPTDADSGLVLINLPTTANSQQTTMQAALFPLPDLAKLKIKTPINFDPPALLDTLAFSEDEPAKPGNDAGDGLERERLFGIYTGQIQARIDRVWRRPRTPVSEANDTGDSFQCQAQIVQDAKGNVQEILLPRCNGSAAWQRSLVAAIEQASPLPAPPSTKVFSRSITLSFVGLAYALGSSEDGYELQARVDSIKNKTPQVSGHVSFMRIGPHEYHSQWLLDKK